MSTGTAGPLSDSVSDEDSRSPPAAVDNERNKLKNLPARDVKKVKRKAEVVRRAKKDGRPVQFAFLMDCCHLQHAEFAKHLQKYTRRVVLRGDNVQGDNGYSPVFAEQAASASHMAAENLRDTISRLLDVVGEINDAIFGHTGVRMSEDPRLLRLLEKERPLRPSRRPKQWDTIEEPVVPPEGNSHGHPWARLLWDYWKRSFFSNTFGTHSTNCRKSLCPSKFTTIFVRVCGRHLLRM